MKKLNQKGFAPLVVIVIVIAVLAIGGYFVVKSRLAVAPIYSSTPTASATPDKTAGWKTYTNSEYGFQLTFTDEWRGYIATKSRFNAPNNFGWMISFEVPTNDATYYSQNPGQKYATPMAMGIFTQVEWKELQREGGPNPTYIAQNSNFVFTYSTWQDPPRDLLNINFNFDSVINSFKFTK